MSSKLLLLAGTAIVSSIGYYFTLSTEEKKEKLSIPQKIYDMSERIIGAHKKDDLPPDWTDLGFLFRTAKAVCRIIVYGAPYGTGFLIQFPAYCNQRFIMTNAHVIGSYESATHAVAEFFYDEDASKTLHINLNPKKFFCVSPYQEEPDLLHLDYSLIGFDYPEGEVDSKSFQEIDPFFLSNDIPTKGSRIAIIQHPKGEPKKYHQASITGVRPHVLLHTVDTEGGSSGSPCLEKVDGRVGRVIALHHQGGEKANRAILAASILADVAISLRLEGQKEREEKERKAIKERVEKKRKKAKRRKRKRSKRAKRSRETSSRSRKAKERRRRTKAKRSPV